MTVVAGGLAVGVWLMPLSLSQPGGFGAWARATRIETDGAAQASSMFDHAAAGANNLGTFAGNTPVALAPVAVLAVLAGGAGGAGPDAHRGAADHSWSGPGDREGGSARGAVPAPRRPWYQIRSAVLTAAIIPPALLVTLVGVRQGWVHSGVPACGGDRPPPSARCSSTEGRGVGGPPRRGTGGHFARCGPGGGPRVPSGSSAVTGCFPTAWPPTGPVWLGPPGTRRPTPKPVGPSGGRCFDTALAGLGPWVRSGRDVVVFDTVNSGQNIYRNAGWALPDDRIALIHPGLVLYNEFRGALYYDAARTVAVRALGLGAAGRRPGDARSGLAERPGHGPAGDDPATCRRVPGLPVRGREPRCSVSGRGPRPDGARWDGDLSASRSATTDSTKAA